LTAHVDPSRWEEPRIFGEIRRLGRVADDEMARVFNLGLGMVVAVDPGAAGEALGILEAHGAAASVVGELRAGPGGVVLV
jgi:phosphoribosylformylglycinamidine cyclo-ligase